MRYLSYVTEFKKGCGQLAKKASIAMATAEVEGAVELLQLWARNRLTIKRIDHGWSLLRQRKLAAQRARAATKINGLVRSFLGRVHIMKMAQSIYSKYVDTDRCLWALMSDVRLMRREYEFWSRFLGLWAVIQRTKNFRNGKFLIKDKQCCFCVYVWSPFVPSFRAIRLLVTKWQLVTWKSTINSIPPYKDKRVVIIHHTRCFIVCHKVYWRIESRVFTSQ